MRARSRLPAWWLASSSVVALAGAVALAAAEWGARQSAFQTDARIAHRLLSQRAAQHDAILATLVLLQPAVAAGEAPEQRLPAVYPQVLQVYRRDRGAEWTGSAADREALSAAEAESLRARRATTAAVDAVQGQYLLVLAGVPSSFALRIDVAAMVPRAEWPFAADAAVQVGLELSGQRQALSAAVVPPGRWRFEFGKPLAAESQPFALTATQAMAPGAWPWGRIAGWITLVALGLAAAAAWQRQREERRRARELLRLGQVGRLNALGELAAGMAHELNQPLTAVLANVQAADRWLADDPPELGTARQAMQQAVQQARRASEVVGRLRRVVERPNVADHLQSVPAEAALRSALDLLEPECRRLAVTPELEGPPAMLRLRAEPVALEQILHNLLSNALQALAQVPAAERRLRLSARAEGDSGVLTVADSGPGLSPEALPRVFEPFFSTRPGGLGLGLSLCETLAQSMGGALTVANVLPHGAEFRLTLPLATP